MLLLVAALQFPPMQNFPEINRPGTYADLRGSVEHACGITAQADVKTMIDREFKAAWDVHGSNVQVDKWLILGCARADLAGERSPSSPGPLMDAGNSWAQGSERAMQEVLKLRPGDTRAAEVLGLLALDDNEPDNLKTAAVSVIAAVERGVSTPGTLRACAELAAQTHAEAAMRTCSEKALRAGYDSTWHLTRLAQLAFRGSDSVQGAKLFLLAASVARDSLARQEVNWHLQWFLTPDERTAWASVPDSTRGTWLRDKLVMRDVRDGQPLGARLAEHFSRLEYVEANFRLQVPRRTREALRTGPSMDDSSTYANDTLVANTCEAGKVRATPFRFYPRWQTDFDDRGVVWMRFGAPEKRIRANATCRLPAVAEPSGISREVWLYNLDGERMLLNFEYEAFSGSTQATRLVTGVLGSYMCDVDVRRCGLTELAFAMWCATNRSCAVNLTVPQSEFVKPEDILHLHHEDAEYISVATTKDDNSPRGEKNVAVVSRLHRLWDPITSAPIALVTYALPIKDLSIQKSDGERTTAVHLELRQWEPAADQWRDTAFTRRFTVPDTNLKPPNLVGFVTATSAPGVTAWSFVATQSDQRRGRAYDVTTAPLSNGPLVLSDLVLGAESQGVVWNFHNVEIPLAPTTVLDRKVPVSLYYQIKSDVARADLRTTAALYRVVDGVARDSAALQMTYDQAVHEGINEVAPTLDVSRLDKGSYALEVRLTDAEGKVLARRRAALDLE
jgi:hypothetical protein